MKMSEFGSKSSYSHSPKNENLQNTYRSSASIQLLMGDKLNRGNPRTTASSIPDDNDFFEKEADHEKDTTDTADTLEMFAFWASGSHSDVKRSTIKFDFSSSGAIGYAFTSGSPDNFVRGTEYSAESKQIHIPKGGPMAPIKKTKNYRLEMRIKSLKLSLRGPEEEIRLCFDRLKNCGARLVDHIEPIDPTQNSTPQSARGKNTSSTPANDKPTDAQVSQTARPPTRADTIISTAAAHNSHRKRSFDAMMSQTVDRDHNSDDDDDDTIREVYRPAIYEDEGGTRYIVLDVMSSKDGIWQPKKTPKGQLKMLGISSDIHLENFCHNLTLRKLPRRH